MDAYLIVMVLAAFLLMRLDEWQWRKLRRAEMRDWTKRIDADRDRLTRERDYWRDTARALVQACADGEAPRSAVEDLP